MSVEPASITSDPPGAGTGPHAVTDGEVRRVVLQRMMRVHSGLPLLLPGMIVFIAVTMEPAFPSWLVAGWVAASCLIWADIAVFYRRYFTGRLGDDTARIERQIALRYTAGVSVWSAVMLIYWSHTDDTQNFFLITLAVSHLSVATAIAGQTRRVFLAATAPLAPIIILACVIDGATIYLGVAVLTAMAYAFMFAVARNTEQHLVSAVRVNLGHDALIRDLGAAKAASDRALADAEQANARLAASEKRFRALVDNAFDGILIASADGRITFATEAVARMFETTQAELIGRPATSLAVAESRAGAEAGLAQVFDEAGAQVSAAGWGATASGRSIWVDVTARNMIDETSVGGIVLNMRDATARKRASENLKMHLGVLEALATDSPMQKILGDLAAKIEQLYPGIRAMIALTDDNRLSVTAAPSLPQDYLALIEGRPAGPASGPCGIAADQGRAAILADAAKDPCFDGHPGLAEAAGIGAVWAQPMMSRDGTVLGAVAMIDTTARQPEHDELSFLRDAAQLAALAIDRRRAAQRLAEALRTAEVANHSKTQFLANMSHELRTPLNAIIGFAEIIREEIFGPIGQPEYTEYVKDIHSSGHHLLALINDILDISKIEAGQMELEDSLIDVGGAIRWSAELVGPRAREKGVALETGKPDGLPHLRGDERAVRQILLNLLSNAVKFTPPGGRVSIQAEAGAAGYLIKVQDTGIGIAPEMVERVLEPFVQAEDPMARTHGGTGLGLPITKALTEMHGGTLKIESTPGRGTTVTVKLPATRIAAASLSVAAPQVPPRALQG